MFNTNKFKQTKNEEAGWINRRRSWSIFEKLQIVEESKRSIEAICSVAQKYEISPSQLYLWRRLERDGTLKAFKEGEEVVPASTVKRLQLYINDLELLLEEKSEELETLRATISGNPIIKDLEKYPHLRMAVKYNLFDGINI